MNTRVLIVDDEPLAREVIRLLLEPRKDITVVSECGSGQEAVERILAGGIDLVFLDIQMPDLDGFEVIDAIGVEHMPAVVFVTAYDEFALKAFEKHALDYLLKPFDEERFTDALCHALRAVREVSSEDLARSLAPLLDHYRESDDELKSRRESGSKYLSRVIVKQSGRVFFLKSEQIDWVEAAGDYVALHVGSKKYMLHQTLRSFEERLDPTRFLRIHRSSIVNVDRIRELQPHFNGEYVVLMEDGTELKLTRTYRSNLRPFLGETGRPGE